MLARGAHSGDVSLFPSKDCRIGRRGVAAGAMEERADELVQTAIAAVVGYFAVAVGLAAVFPVFGGCVPVPTRHRPGRCYAYHLFRGEKRPALSEI